MFTLIYASSPQELADALLPSLRQAVSSGKQATLLVPSATWARERKDELAQSVPFGVSVLTFFQFVHERWEVEGDGRALVNPEVRSLLIQELVKKHNETCDEESASIRALSEKAEFLAEIARLVQKMAGATDTAAIDTAALDLSARERGVLEIALAYLDEIERRRLIEANEALANLELAHAGVSLFVEGTVGYELQQIAFLEHAASWCDIVVTLEYDETDVRYRGAKAAFDAVSALADTCKKLHAEQKEPTSREAEEPRFDGKRIVPLITQGPHARNANIARFLKNQFEKEAFEPQDCLVMCRCLDARTQSLLQACALEGIPVRAKLRLRVGDSGLGHALHALRALCKEGRVDAARRFIASPFCGLFSEQAYRIDAGWCARAETTVEDCKRDLAKESEQTAYILELAEAVFCQKVAAGADAPASAGDPASLNEAARALCNHLLEVGIRRSVELETFDKADAYAAAASIERAIDQATAARMVYTFDDLETLCYAKTYANKGGVTFASSNQMPYATYQLVLAAGLEAVNYPMETDPRSLDRLARNLGVVEEGEQREKIRLLFARMTSRARETLVLERNLYDSEGREVRASALWDDVMDAYRTEDEDEKSEVPAVLRDMVATANEGDLAAILPARDEATRTLRTDAAMGKGEAFIFQSEKQRGEAHDLEQLLAQTQVLSPTQIETYLCCPYKWFFEKRLAPRTFHEDFGPLQQGSFVHAVLELFYRRFTGRDLDAANSAIATANEKRVTADNLAQAWPVLEGCLAQCEEQAEGFNPVDASQKLDVERLFRNISRFIESDADFLPGYEPSYFEYRFGDDEAMPVKYAGELVRGTIDRIDVHAEAGYGAVIDYKTGSLGKYVLPSSNKQISPPGPFVQAHIYATIMERLLDLKPVASLYRSVGSSTVAGAWDGNRLDDLRSQRLPTNGCLPRKKPMESDPNTYQDYLDCVEEYVSERLVCLRAGDIRPAPTNSAICDYCLARTVCGGRASGGEQ